MVIHTNKSLFLLLLKFAVQGIKNDKLIFKNRCFSFNSTYNAYFFKSKCTRVTFDISCITMPCQRNPTLEITYAPFKKYKIEGGGEI